MASPPIVIPPVDEVLGLSAIFLVLSIAVWLVKNCCKTRVVDPSPEQPNPKLPTVPLMSSEKGREGSYCVVCLSALEDGEAVRHMPQCGHVFHKSCIDPWLLLHPVCPLCRHVALVVDPTT